MSIVEKSTAFVKQKFEDGDTGLLTYHNWGHTQKVFEAATVIATNTKEFETEKLEELQLAAVFHDIGFLEGANGHEERGAQIAEDFLTDNDYDTSKIDLVKRLILATKMDHEASDLYESIIKDADLFHLGSPDYMQTTFVNLPKEINNLNLTDKKICGLEEWRDMCISFISKHRYHTKYARDSREEVKKQNLEKMKEIVPEKVPMENMVSKEDKTSTESKGKKKKKKPTKADSPLKGVETMFKVSLRNHVNLSQIADNKANTLISVNAIIISIVLSALFPKLDSNPFLFYPGMSFLFFTIVTIILAILSTIPNVNRGVITKKEVLAKKGNLLFFGNFFKMGLDEYEWSMKELMNDKEYLYDSLSRDLYFLGKVLHKKYKLLRLAYYSFVIGLITTSIIFVTSILSVIQAS